MSFQVNWIKTRFFHKHNFFQVGVVDDEEIGGVADDNSADDVKDDNETQKSAPKDPDAAERDQESKPVKFAKSPSKTKIRSTRLLPHQDFFLFVTDIYDIQAWVSVPGKTFSV